MTSVVLCRNPQRVQTRRRRMVLSSGRLVSITLVGEEQSGQSPAPG